MICFQIHSKLGDVSPKPRLSDHNRCNCVRLSAPFQIPITAEIHIEPRNLIIRILWVPYLPLEMRTSDLNLATDSPRLFFDMLIARRIIDRRLNSLMLNAVHSLSSRHVLCPVVSSGLRNRTVYLGHQVRATFHTAESFAVCCTSVSTNGTTTPGFTLRT